MLSVSLPPWLHSALCVAGMIAGVALHLAWHPLRRHFSDAMDFLRTHTLPLWLMMAGMAAERVLALGLHPAPDETPAPSWAEPGALHELALASLQQSVMLFHEAFTPWPLVLGLPLLLLALAVQILRYPYRYQKRKPGLDQILLLVLVNVAGIAWAAMEIFAAPRAGPGLMQDAIHTLRAAFSLLGAAAFSVWLARLVIVWDEPESGWSLEDVKTAVGQCFARWQNILGLGVFNLLWFSLLLAKDHRSAWVSRLILPEVLFVFAPLPLSIAAGSGSFPARGGEALRTLGRRFFPLLAHLVTTTTLLMMAGITLASARALSAAHGWGVWPAEVARVLMLALLHSWLLVAGLLILRRGASTAAETAQ